jgi:hypothetical protein
MDSCGPWDWGVFVRNSSEASCRIPAIGSISKFTVLMAGRNGVRSGHRDRALRCDEFINQPLRQSIFAINDAEGVNW